VIGIGSAYFGSQNSIGYGSQSRCVVKSVTGLGFGEIIET
jgi:hypothetical protein